jgi:putative hydrolase of HD superfamily
MTPLSHRLAQQIAFALEADKLKGVLRQTWLTDQSRRENSAEHSWHAALMAVLLAEHAAAGPTLDVARVVRMMLVHDLVEIDAGDTLVYDDAAAAGKARRERDAAQRIFGLLPDDQAAELRAAWDEFEARQTPEARFAAALDRVQPILHNFATQGRAWREHGVTAARVLEKNRHIAEGSPALWEFIRELVSDAVARGYLEP